MGGYDPRGVKAGKRRKKKKEIQRSLKEEGGGKRMLDNENDGRN